MGTDLQLGLLQSGLGHDETETSKQNHMSLDLELAIRIARDSCVKKTYISVVDLGEKDIPSAVITSNEKYSWWGAVITKTCEGPGMALETRL